MPLLADALVFVHCAHTSLAILDRCGMLPREQVLYRRLFPHFDQVAVVSYGDESDLALGAGLVPEMLGRIWTICNTRKLDPAVFLAGVPDRVLQQIEPAHRVLIITDQHFGGDVALCIAQALRAAGKSVGLVARGGYHWSWFMAREQGADSAAYTQARFLEGELAHAADIVVGTTSRMLDDLAMLHGLPRGKLRLVPNYVEAPKAAPPQPREPGLILSAGRLHPQKRFDLLMRSVAALPESLRAHTRLLILGQGPDEASLRSLASTLPASIEIRPRVPHGELLELMSRCTLYAQCSAYEGHPKTIIEALACGCPTLVTEGPGVAECIEPSITGLLSRPEASALARSLERLLTDPALAAQLGRAAAQAAARELDINVIFPRYFAACEEAMSLAGAGASIAPPMLRWDPPLLNLGPDQAAATWHAALHAYARRLHPAAREAFVQGLSARIGSLASPRLPIHDARRALAKP